MNLKFKLRLIILILSFSIAGQLYAWGGDTHRGMTRAAAKFVFGPFSTVKIDSFFVPVNYSMAANFSKTMMMGFAGGVFSTFVGLTLDNTVFKDDLAVDDTMYYGYPETGPMTVASMFAEAGQDPDNFDGEVLMDGGPKVLHMYSPNGIGYADVMTEYFYNKAKDAISNKDTLKAFVYLGYASHYLADCGIPVHTEMDFINIKVLLWQWKFHHHMEDWISSNWSKKWNMKNGSVISFSEEADSAAKVPVPVCDVAGSVRSLSFETYPDLAEWMDAWGNDVNKGPKDEEKFIELVIQEIWRSVPRITGMFMKFKTEEM